MFEKMFEEYKKMMDTGPLLALSPFLIIASHIGMLFMFSVFVMLVLSYLGYSGEISSMGLFFLWKKLGSNFLPFMILILSAGVMLVVNPVYALICLIAVFFSTSVFLISLNVKFLGLIYLIIYLGAIAILFLFVIMMFNLRELNQQTTGINNDNAVFFSFSLYSLILWKFYSIISEYTLCYVEYDKYFNNFANKKLESLQYFLTYQYTDTLLFGTLLYDYYSYLFILAALILLTSMLGSIILALSTTEKTTNFKPSISNK